MMRKKVILTVFLTTALLITSIFSGCQLIDKVTNKIPENYTEGIKYDRDFPDNDIEIYDNATVFESRKLFDAIILTMGTEDDFDDVVDFYKDFFENNSITLSEEKDERDEYYARGFYEGYEFKIKVEEADGEYVEDLFECVIYISAEARDDAQMNAATTASPAPSDTAPTKEPSNTQKPTATPNPQNDTGETPLSFLETGIWTVVSAYSNGQYVSEDNTMYIGADGTGTFYYFSYYGDQRTFYDFSYSVESGNFYVTVGGQTGGYDAYLDDGILHLVSQDSNEEMYMVNWSEQTGVYPSGNIFTAYGDWVYYEPETGYMEIIAFWPDGSGYIYNWGGSYENLYMDWDYDRGTFTISDQLGDEYSYGIVHLGEVFELHQSNGSVFFYNRVSAKNWLTGYFSMDITGDEGVSEWSINLNYDGTCTSNVNGIELVGSWWIDSSTGKLTLSNDSFEIAFDYHYDIEGLHLWDAGNSMYYHFLQIG